MRMPSPASSRQARGRRHTAHRVIATTPERLVSGCQFILFESRALCAAHACTLEWGRMSDDEDDSLLACSFMLEGAAEKVERQFEFGRTDVSVPTVTLSVRCIEDEPGGIQSGHYVWPAAPHLAEHIVKTGAASSINGGIIELGAGCGLSGLTAAHRHTQARIALTDHDPGVVETLSANVALQPSSVAARCAAHQLSWGDEGENELRAIIAQVGGRVALVVAADCVYAAEIVRPLFWTVRTLLAPGVAAANAHAVLCMSFDIGDEAEAAIARACQEFGLEEDQLEVTETKPELEASAERSEQDASQVEDAEQLPRVVLARPRLRTFRVKGAASLHD